MIVLIKKHTKCMFVTLIKITVYQIITQNSRVNQGKIRDQILNKETIGPTGRHVCTHTLHTVHDFLLMANKGDTK